MHGPPRKRAPCAVAALTRRCAQTGGEHPHRAVSPVRRSIRPQLGQVVAFDGGLFHGGEPIVRGTRYIIAAFLYVSQPAAAPAGDSAPAAAERQGCREERGAKRQRTSSLFAELAPPLCDADGSAWCAGGSASCATASFSFGFG